MEDILIYYCKQLKLGSTIITNAKTIKYESNETFLIELLRLELENRELKRRNLNLKQANFDVVKTFEGYKVENIVIPDTLDLQDIKECNFIDRKENLIFYGPTGRGKTHLATAIGVEACNRGKRVKFYRTVALVNDLVEAKQNGNIKRFTKVFEKLDLLICDEWGYIPVDKDGAKLLFQVVSECYERRSVIITTNLEFGNWNGIFYDEKLTAAIIDRLVHHSHLLLFDGPSYRLENSLMKGMAK